MLIRPKFKCGDIVKIVAEEYGPCTGFVLAYKHDGSLTDQLGPLVWVGFSHEEDDWFRESCLELEECPSDQSSLQE